MQNLYEMVFLDEKKLKLIYCGVCHCEIHELQHIVVEDQFNKYEQNYMSPQTGQIRDSPLQRWTPRPIPKPITRFRSMGRKAE